MTAFLASRGLSGTAAALFRHVLMLAAKLSRDLFAIAVNVTSDSG